MKILALLALFVLAAGWPTEAQAQYVRLSWGTCDPQVADTTFSGPGIYKLVMSAIGVDGALIGHDSRITIGPEVQDAWRFDDGGCQGSERLTISSNALNKACPSLRGANPLAITHYGYDPETQTVEIRLAVAFDSLVASPGTRYTLWQLSFDHTYSAAAADSDSATCDNAGPPYGYDLGLSAVLLRTTGITEELPNDSADVTVTWNGGAGDSKNMASTPRPSAMFPPETKTGLTDVFRIMGEHLDEVRSVRLEQVGRRPLGGMLQELTPSRINVSLTVADADTGFWDLLVVDRRGAAGRLSRALRVWARRPASIPQPSFINKVTACFGQGALPLTRGATQALSAVTQVSSLWPGTLRELGALSIRSLWPDAQPQPTASLRADGVVDTLFDFSRCYEITFPTAQQAAAAAEWLKSGGGLDVAVQQVANGGNLDEDCLWSIPSCTKVLPNDYWIHYQWSINNEFAPTLNEDTRTACAWNDPKAWGSEAVTIGFVDTGIDADHLDLQRVSAPWGNKVMTGQNFYSGADSLTVVDLIGHGTQVASLAAAITNNGDPYAQYGNYATIAGVAGGWYDEQHPFRVGARIVPVRFHGHFDEDFPSPDVAAAAINWAANAGVNVINCSFEYWIYFYVGVPPDDPHVYLLRKALENALKKGAITVAAMGNYDIWRQNPSYPAGFAQWGLCTAVGASDECSRRVTWQDHPGLDEGIGSTPGTYIDLMAPGYQIQTDWPHYCLEFDPDCTQIIAHYSIFGTSFSTALVSGVAASLLNIQPALRDVDVKQLLRLTAEDINGTAGTGDSIYTGKGRVNHVAAAQALDTGARNVLIGGRVAGAVVADSVALELEVRSAEGLGLADGTYEAERYCYEFEVAFPMEFSQPPMTWARVNGTSGWSAENPHFFNYGWAEPVAGTVTTTGARYHSYYYRIGSAWYPTNPGSAAVEYSAVGHVAGTTSADAGGARGIALKVVRNPARAGEIAFFVTGPKGAVGVVQAFDVSGREVWRSVAQVGADGLCKVNWPTARSHRVGMYFVRLIMGPRSQVEKVVVLP